MAEPIAEEVIVVEAVVETPPLTYAEVIQYLVVRQKSFEDRIRRETGWKINVAITAWNQPKEVLELAETMGFEHSGRHDDQHNYDLSVYRNGSSLSSVTIFAE